MEKTHLETFIKKYSLNSLINSVRWVSSGKSLTCSAIASDKKLLAEVEFTNFDGYGDAELGIMDTSKLKQMMGAVSEKVTLSLVRAEDDTDRIINLILADDRTEVQYVCGDTDVISKAPGKKNLPTEYDVEIKMTDTFIDKFLKAKAALPESDLFTLIMSKKRNKLEMVLGYGANINNNRIAVDLDLVDGKDKVTRPVSFSSKAWKEIITANSECKDAVMKVSEKGISSVEYATDGFKAVYYSVEVNTED